MVINLCTEEKEVSSFSTLESLLYKLSVEASVYFCNVNVPNQRDTS